MYTLFSDIAMIFVYLFTSLLTVFLLGWLVYDKLFLRGVSLKTGLFEKNSLSVWLEFIGGFLAPVLVLVSIVMAPNGKFVYRGEWKDLIPAVGYITAYIIVFSLFRLLAGKIVEYAYKLRFNRAINMKDEVFSKNNNALSLLSISISVMVLGLILQENILHESFITNLARITFVVIMITGLLSVYIRYFFPRNSSLLNLLFVRDNTSSGILLLSQTISINLLVNSSIQWLHSPAYNWLNPANLIDHALFISLLFLIMLVIVSILKSIMEKVLNINISDELFEQDNTGYALLEGSLYILLSIIIKNGLML